MALFWVQHLAMEIATPSSSPTMKVMLPFLALVTFSTARARKGNHTFGRTDSTQHFQTSVALLVSLLPLSEAFLRQCSGPSLTDPLGIAFRSGWVRVWLSEVMSSCSAPSWGRRLILCLFSSVPTAFHCPRTIGTRADSVGSLVPVGKTRTNEHLHCM